MSSKKDKTQAGTGSRLALRGALVAGAAAAFVGVGAGAAMAAGPDDASSCDGTGAEAAPAAEAAPSGAVESDVAPAAEAAPVTPVAVSAPVEVTAVQTQAQAPEGSLARWYQDGVGTTDEQAQAAEPTSGTVAVDTPAPADDQGVEQTADPVLIPAPADDTLLAGRAPVADIVPTADETPAADVTDAPATAPFMGTWYAPDGSSRLTVHEQSLGLVPSSIPPDHEGLVEDLPGAWWHAVDGTTATVDWHTMIGNYQQTMTLLVNGTLQLSGGGRPTVVYSRSAVLVPKTEAPTSEPPATEDPTTEDPTAEAPVPQAPVAEDPVAPVPVDSPLVGAWGGKDHRGVLELRSDGTFADGSGSARTVGTWTLRSGGQMAALFFGDQSRGSLVLGSDGSLSFYHNGGQVLSGDPVPVVEKLGRAFRCQLPAPKGVPTAHDPVSEPTPVVDYPAPPSGETAPTQLVDYPAPHAMPSSGEQAPTPGVVYATPLVATPSPEDPTADVDYPVGKSVSDVGLSVQYLAPDPVTAPTETPAATVDGGPVSLVDAWMAAQGLDNEDAVLDAWGRATGGPTAFLMMGPLSVDDGMPVSYHLAKDAAMQWAAAQALAWAATTTEEPGAPVGTVLADDVDGTTATDLQTEVPPPPEGVTPVDATTVLADSAGMVPVGAVTAGDGSQAILVLFTDAHGLLQVGAVSAAEAAGEVAPTPHPVTGAADDTSLVPVGVVTAADGSQLLVVLYVGADGVVRVGQVPAPVGAGDQTPVVQPEPAPAPVPTPVVQPVVTPPPAVASGFVGQWVPENAPKATTVLTLSADGTLVVTGAIWGPSLDTWTQTGDTTGTWGKPTLFTTDPPEGVGETTVIPASKLTLLPDGRLQVVRHDSLLRATTTYYTKVVVPAPAPTPQDPEGGQSSAPAYRDFVGQYQTDASVRYDSDYKKVIQSNPAAVAAGVSKVGSGQTVPVVVHDDGTLTVGTDTFGWVQTGPNTLTVTVTDTSVPTYPQISGPEGAHVPESSGPYQTLYGLGSSTTIVAPRVKIVGTITMLDDGRLSMSGLFDAWVTASPVSAPVVGAPLHQADSPLVGYWYTSNGLEATVRPDGTISILGHATDGGLSHGSMKINPDGDPVADDTHFPGGPNGEDPVGAIPVVGHEGTWVMVDATTIRATFDVGLPAPQAVATADQAYAAPALPQYVTLTYTLSVQPDGSLTMVSTAYTLEKSITAETGVQTGVRTYAPSFVGSWETTVRSSPYKTSQAHLSLGADGTFTADFGQLGLGSSSTVWVGTWVPTDDTTATLTYTAWDVTAGYGRVLEQGTSQMRVLPNGGLELVTGGYAAGGTPAAVPAGASRLETLAWRAPRTGVSEFYRPDGTVPSVGDPLLATATIPDVLESATPTSTSSMVGLWWSQYPTSLSGAEMGAAMFPLLALGPEGTAVFAQGPEWIPGEGLGEDLRLYAGTWEQVDVSTAVVTLEDGTQITARIGGDGVLRMDLADNPHWPDIAGGGWAFDRMDPEAQFSVYDPVRAEDYKLDTKRHAGDAIGEVVQVAAVVVSVVATVLTWGATAGLVVAAAGLMATGNTFIGPDSPGSGTGSTAATTTTTAGGTESPFGLSPTTESPTFQFNPPGQA